jgi:hypothetical protein
MDELLILIPIDDLSHRNQSLRCRQIVGFVWEAVFRDDKAEIRA